MRLILEFGSWLGLSADYISKRIHPDCILICIDWWKGDTSIGFDVRDDLYEQFLVNIWKYKNNIIPIKMDGKTVMKYLAKLNIKPDLIYLDMDHSYDAVKADLKMLYKCFPNTLILGDDILYWDGVRKAVNEIKTEYNIFSLEINQNCYALIAKKYAEQNNLTKYNYISFLEIKIKDLYILNTLIGSSAKSILELLLFSINYPVLILDNPNLEYIKSYNLVNVSKSKELILSSTKYFKNDLINSKLISFEILQKLIKDKIIQNVIIIQNDKKIKDIDYLYKSDIFNCNNKKFLIQLYDPLNTISNRIYLQSISDIKIYTDEITLQYWNDYWQFCLKNKNNNNFLFVNLNKLIHNKKHIQQLIIFFNKNIDKNKLKYIINNNYFITYNTNSPISNNFSTDIQIINNDSWKKFESHPLIQYILSNNNLLNIIQKCFR